MALLMLAFGCGHGGLEAALTLLPVDAQSRSGPTRPPGTFEGYKLERLGAPTAMGAVTRSKLISDVPAYLWRNGCGPTAAGMVMGYWAGHGFPSLVPGSALTQTDAVNTMISSQENYDDYCLPIDSPPNPVQPDKSELPEGDEHANNCVADWMYASQSAHGYYYGVTSSASIGIGMVSYVQSAAPYAQAQCETLHWSQMDWGAFTAEMDAGHPCVLLVDTQGDGGTDHFITGIGYTEQASGQKLYACYDTWDGSVHWYDFAGIAPGQPWGIFCGTFLSLSQPEPPGPPLEQQIPAVEYAALLDLYTITDGQNWLNNQGWNSLSPSWYGVTVEGFQYDPGTGQILNEGHVTSLNLSFNNLLGSLPDTLGNLASLKSLNLSGNRLFGTVPDTVGTLGDLAYLDLSENRLSGIIPGSVGNLVSLAQLDVTYDCFDISPGGQTRAVIDQLLQAGTQVEFQPQNSDCPTVPGLQQQIPAAEYAALVDLYTSTQGQNWWPKTGWNDPTAPFWDGVTVSGFQYDSETGVILSLGTVTKLELSSHNLFGAIPDSLSNLVNLETLDLSSNSLTWNIPESFGNLAKLRSVTFFGNSLFGSIPASFGNLVNLRSARFTANQFSGAIPDSLGNLVNLESLWLDDNQFSGSIPSTFGNLLNLKALYMDWNSLSGSIPESIGNLANLETLGVSNNRLSGSIPESIGNLLKLPTLDLSHNELSGNIPESIGNLVGLQLLALTSNQLEGQIPASLGNLVNLVGLHLMNNKLSGSIPSSLGNLVKLRIAHFINNQLSGEIPASFVNLQSLQVLTLANRSLSGPLGKNRLSGNIPDFSVLPAFGELDITDNCFDVSPGSSARAMIEKLLQAGKSVSYDPQSPDCAPLSLACPLGSTVPADAGQCSATVEYSAPNSTGGANPVTMACQPPSGSVFPIGINSVTCLATDSNGAQATCSFTLEVQDLEPPTFQQATATPSVLWPPNHAMLAVKIAISTTENCGPATSRIVSVSSNEPVSGKGKGDQAPDWEITGDMTLNLRAERAGTATDRIYSVTVECRDAAGNTSQMSLVVTVPHDQHSK